PTTAFYRIRSQCGKAMRNEDAALADEQLVRQTPAMIALDYDLLGQEAYDAGAKTEAIKQFEAALRLEPTAYWSLMRLGWCLSYGYPPAHAEAVRVYTGCIMKRPDVELGYFHRGIAYANLGRNEEALADHSKAVELEPTHAKAWFNRAEVYCQLGRWDRALVDFSRAIELNPRSATAWQDRGETYRR